MQDAVGGDFVPEDREDAEVKKSGLMNKIRGVRVISFSSREPNDGSFTPRQDNLTDRIPQEHKDRANDHYDSAKRVLTEEYFPEERRDQFIYRGKKVRGVLVHHGVLVNLPHR